MKALSFISPYGYLAAAGLKPVDNRPWRTKFRGRFYIHTSQKKDVDAIEAWWLGEASSRNAYGIFVDWSRYPFPGFDALVNGAIIGEAELIDCVDEHDSEWYIGPHGLILADPKLYDKPIPCKGALGFFEPSLRK